MEKGGPWSKAKNPARVPKTFYISPGAFEKLKESQAAAIDPVQILEEVRIVIEEKIEKLYRERPLKEPK